MEIDRELQEAFYKEAHKNIETLIKGLNQLLDHNKEYGRGHTIDTVFIAAHTLTTNAAYMKRTEMNELARAMKEILRAATENKLELSLDLLPPLIEGAKGCQTLLKEPALKHYDKLLEKLKKIEASV